MFALKIAQFSRRIFLATLLGALSVTAYAADGRDDYDLDDDSLIEINDLGDLDEIRNNLDGTTLYGKSTGCPDTGCNGFELTTDLDFDTNGDGKMDENDEYWNGGAGWEPIGDSSSRFSAAFEGNGFSIRNLYVNRLSTASLGLFGSVSDAAFRNIVLAGPLTSVTGGRFSGLLVGYLIGSDVSGIYAAGRVSAKDGSAGGIAGHVIGRSILQDIQSTVSVVGDQNVGGLIGYVDWSNSVSNSIATGVVSGNLNVGGLVGSVAWDNMVSGSYWAIDSTGQTRSSKPNNEHNYIGVTLAQLQCPTSVDDTSCTGGDTLYAGWSADVWDFGTSGQLPALNINGKVFRDSDGDGVFDEDDAFPFSFAASLDRDQDGYPDKLTSGCGDACLDIGIPVLLDAFLDDHAAGQDDDYDGYPDTWAVGCDLTCQQNSGLTLDEYPDDIDNDGEPDRTDNDNNGDGKTDADADSDGLIEIHSLEQLNAIRFSLDGSARVLSAGGAADNSGCPYIIYNGVYSQRCVGYELVVDLDFDTNGDGNMDENDDYWNEGAGWASIGNSSSPLSTVFEGNGFSIHNLYINRPSAIYLGLFGYASDAEVHRLVLTGPLTSVSGRSYVGLLAGYFVNSDASAIYAAGRVSAKDDYAGGIAGYVSGARIQDMQSAVSVMGDQYVGGLIGSSKASVSNSIATGVVHGNSSVGGLVGDSYYGNLISASHWAADSTGQTSSDSSSATFNYTGATLAQLQCPTAVDDTNCAEGNTLYEDWSSDVWDFGTSGQLPALKINESIFRDSDGDGVFDDDDAFPFSFAASMDIDEDGYPDQLTSGCDEACLDIGIPVVLDAFLDNPAAGQDDDRDGYPDAWAIGCDLTCQQNSGLTLDDYLNDIDNDGQSDSTDSDDNGDGITDADSDSDGLIDIYTLEQLNAIRFSLDGSARVLSAGDAADNSGCPYIIYNSVYSQRCIGYELMADLDFDTNGDGNMDENDNYWNEGAGWASIGSSSSPLSTVFEGNGFSIHNLYINRPSAIYLGLFGYTSDAEVHRLVLTGPLTSVSGRRYVGLLAGYFVNSDASVIYAAGRVYAKDHHAGGIAGYVSGASIQDIQSAVSVKGGGNVGGLIGSSGASVSNSIATGVVHGNSTVGGLIGYTYRNSTSSSHWATDSTGQISSHRSDNQYNYRGATLAQLQCPAVADDTNCTEGNTLYADWSSDVWDFGTSGQLPALKINGKIFRDSDGDGVFDEDDAFPFSFAASLDIDQDGYPDKLTSGCGEACLDIGIPVILDAFPDNSAAGQDEDHDGYPDNWVAGCDTVCQQNSGLTLDKYPGDIDNDGAPDSIDSDDNGDGVTDADADSDGLIDIYTLEQLNAVRFNLSGHARVLFEGAENDSSGCPIFLEEDAYVQRCHGYELMADLDFDTNGDGLMDERDTYWNNGAGWQPVGDEDNPFLGTFSGNGFALSNLYIERPDDDCVGLFSSVGMYQSGSERAYLRDIVIKGSLTSVVGQGYVAILAGCVDGVSIENVMLYGSIDGYWDLGGIAGKASNSAINNVIVIGNIARGDFVGGIVAELVDSSVKRAFAAGMISGTDLWNAGGIVGLSIGSSIEDVISTVSVLGDENSGSIAGYIINGSLVRALGVGEIVANEGVGGLAAHFVDSNAYDSYWAIDSTGQEFSDSENNDMNFIGATLAELQCPTSPDDTSCAEEKILYAGWSTDVWDFGSNKQLPGLIIGDVIYRDSDGDGALDVNSAPAVTIRLTQDGQEETTIVAGMGDVTLEALVSDPDVWDLHTYSWSLEGINGAIELGNTITFKTDNLPAGDYRLSVTVTDSGYPQMSDTAEITVRVISDVTEPVGNPDNNSEQAPAKKKKGGGGSLQWWLLLLAAGVIRRPARFAV